MLFDQGSFRDPSGRIVLHDARVFRAMFPMGSAPLIAAQEAGVLDDLAENGHLLPARPVSNAQTQAALRQIAPHAQTWLEHRRLPFVSYPYEWCFSGLKAAALLHLDVHIDLLSRGFTLSDATAYNVQFQGTKPVFIDYLAIIPYEECALWQGQRQFGMQFLNPLFLWAKKGHRSRCLVPWIG